jgi:co-chaperonin GroES (HSP10)
LIKVVLHRVLVRRDIPEDTNAIKTKKEIDRLGLAMPEGYKAELDKQALRENASMDKGTILQLGDTAFKDYGIEAPVKVGDYITYAKFGGKEVVDPATGETLVVINDEDVVAILSKEPLDG